jgi:hypothetical protein
VPNGNRYISGGDYVDDKGWDCVGIIIKGEGWDEDGGAEGRDLEGAGCDDEGIYVGCDEGGSKPILSNGVLEGVATACDGKVQAVTKEEADPSSPPSASSQESANLLSPLP